MPDDERASAPSARRTGGTFAAEWLLAASVAAGMAGLSVAAEVACRLFDPRYLCRVRGCMVYSQIYGWDLRPGFEGELHDVWMTVDARGHRGDGRARPVPPGRARVVMLGDSITFGSWARDGDTFSALLEGRYDVVNLGVEGYGTAQELLKFEHEGSRERPDVVVLNFTVANDVSDNASAVSGREEEGGQWPVPYFTLDAPGALVLHDAHVRLDAAHRLAQWLQDDSYLVNHLSLVPRTNRVIPPADPEHAPSRFWESPRARDEAERVTVALIGRVQASVRATGARFVVLFHPDEPTFGMHASLADRLHKALDERGVGPVISMADAYRHWPYAWPAISRDYQGHLTPLGHRVAATEMEAVVDSVLRTVSPRPGVSGRVAETSAVPSRIAGFPPEHFRPSSRTGPPPSPSRRPARRAPSPRRAADGSSGGRSAGGGWS
jgi:GDSL-like lipase/acylhydrolase family protein